MEGNPRAQTPTPRSIEQLLLPGDRRTVGAAGDVAVMVVESPNLMDDLVACLTCENPGIRMRAADALEKATSHAPGLLAPCKANLLKVMSETRQQEVQWHMAQMAPRLDLTAADVATVTDVLNDWLASSPSSIVQVMCMQALADLASQGRVSPQSAIDTIAPYGAAERTPSVRSRARALVARLSRS